MSSDLIRGSEGGHDSKRIPSTHKNGERPWLAPLLLKRMRPALSGFRRVIGRDLLRQLAGQFHEMIELRLEPACARRDRP
jgi:hypothetical protein